MDLKLIDKTALVSGSTKGIGFAIATGLAREGARVIVNGRTEKAVAEAKQHMVQTQPGARIESFAGEICGTIERWQTFCRIRTRIFQDRPSVFTPEALRDA